jgi:DNA-binding SARP family transcriptional activator
MNSDSSAVKLAEGWDFPLRVQTLGGFRAWRDGSEVASTAWGREKALHLFQFLVTMRGRYLHKEQIVDRMWPTLDWDTSNRDFRVALNAVYKALEPERKARSDSRFVQRNGLAYGLYMDRAWVDADAFESLVKAGNRAQPDDQDAAIEYYQAAVQLYEGDYLPERRYEDWASTEQERLQVLALGTMTALGKLLLERSPLESVRLTQRVLSEDPVWEDAYRVQMQAYQAQGNRPLALRTYQRCVQMLELEFGVGPLPETVELHEEIRGIG